MVIMLSQFNKLQLPNGTELGKESNYFILTKLDVLLDLI